MKKKKIVIYSIFIFLILIFIFGNSMISGDTSSEESGFFSNIFINIFFHNYDKLSITRQLEISSFSNHIVRKAAHVTEYLTLGIFVLLLLKETLKKKYIYILMPVAVYIVALIDEFIQTFTPARGPSIKDTFIDLSGALIFSIIMYLITIYRKRNRHEN